jgi:hypothetical protein
MPLLTGRREKQAGPVISALVAAVLLLGVACALPAFAASGSGSAGAQIIGLCPPTGTATAVGIGTTAAGDPSADPTDSSGPTGAGTPTGTATATATPSGTATGPDCGSLPPTSTTATATATAPPTTVAPTTTPATIPPVTYPTEPTSTFTYIDTPPGNTTQTLPHGTITRAQIISRAETWVDEQVPYSQISYWTDEDGTYRQDCSGYVSMAWQLNQNIDFWTGNLNTVSHTIDPADLLPGDTLMSVEHTIIFAGWADAQHTSFNFFEEAHPGTIARFVVDAPLTAYTENGFNAFRYDGVVGSASSLPEDPSSGLSFAELSAGGSELVPTGVSPVEPAPAPWQKTVPNEQALAALLASASTPGKSPAKAVDPQLAALAMDPAGPAPLPLLLGTAVLSILFLTVALVRNRKLKVYRRRH